jgi:hypothetical protein
MEGSMDNIPEHAIWAFGLMSLAFLWHIGRKLDEIAQLIRDREIPS